MPGLRVNLPMALILVWYAVVGMLMVAFRPHPAVVAVVGALPLFVLVGAAMAVRARLQPFERDFAMAAQSGEVARMKQVWARATVLRAFAPKWMMLPRRGLIETTAGDHRAAEETLEEAWLATPPMRREALLGPLCRVKYAVGEFADLKELAEEWRVRALFPGSANLYLAVACIEWAEPDLERARSLLDEVDSSLGPVEQELATRIRARLDA